MAYSYNLETTNSISFEEFIDKVSINLDYRDPSTLKDCVIPSQMLSNNDTFLIDILNNQLDDFDEFQKNNTHSAQSISLYNSPQFYIRVNAWPVTTEEDDWQDELYKTLEAHDHNFDFLTVGYFGAGYKTEIWEYDYNSVIGFVGETVDMNFLETTMLPKGKAMIYRASKDIHAQFPAKEYSLSINIMPNNPDTFRREQFWFNLKERKIRALAENVGTGRYLLFDIAKIFGNDTTIDLMEKISNTHEIPYVKVRATEALVELTRDEKIWEKKIEDNNNVVKSYAKLFTEGKFKF